MKKIIKPTATILIAILILAGLQRLVMPNYMADITEGNMIADYYNETVDHDVIFIGDCEVYENFSPAVLWEDYGISSYIRGSAEQLVWQSYYLLEDTLSYETPDVVVFNVLAMEFNEPQRESYNRMTIDGMRWSPSKIGAINASMTDEESFIEYVFPILRYHSRITELEDDDFKYFTGQHATTFSGYYMRMDVLPATDFPKGHGLMDYTFGDNAYYYLDKMRLLCEEKGVELVLIKAPSLYPVWYDEWDQQMVDYAAKYNLKYYNFLEDTDVIGLDFNEDTYDAGLHLNLYGATKLSRYFGDILVNDCQLADHRNDVSYSSIWDKKLTEYYNFIDSYNPALESKDK